MPLLILGLPLHHAGTLCPCTQMCHGKESGSEHARNRRWCLAALYHVRATEPAMWGWQELVARLLTGRCAQPPAWAPMGGPGHMHPPGRGACHLHAGVSAGLCLLEAAHPAAPGTVLGDMPGRGPHFPAQVPYSSLRASLWSQAACGWSQWALADITVPTPVTMFSAWLHFHCLSILPSPAVVGPHGCSGGAVVLPEEGVSRAPARGQREEGAPAPCASRGEGVLGLREP